MAITEYQPGTTFPGVIARTADESTPAWPAPKRAAEDAPNVVFIVLDDTGYGHLGCYGSPIATPNIDALAADGLTYANMNTTALCSPSRSCILNGRNHHSNHLACLTNGSTGYPGSDGYIPFENGFLSEILRAQGYNTYCVGKWHLAPEETMTAAGPYDRWPLGRGFERYYGFLGGDTHQYYPELVRDNSQTEPETTPEQGYHLTPDLVEKATAMIADAKQVAPNKPFFLYFAPGAMHSPHHVPKEWADRYAGKFDSGWEVYRREVFERQKQLGLIPPTSELSARDPDVADWETLSADERRLYARMMEVFAGFLEHTDHCLGELVQFLKDLGEYDNTVIMLISDNGSSAEGGPTGSLNEVRFFNNVPDTVEEAWPASMKSAARRCSTISPGAGRMRATPRSGAGSGRPTGAGRPIRSSSPGHAGSSPGASCARSTPTSSTWCRRCWRLSTSMRRRPSPESRSHRSRGSASRTPSTTTPPRQNT